MRKFFETICKLLGIKHLTTTVYDSRTSGQAKRYSMTLIVGIHNYVDEVQRDRDISGQLLTHAYSTEMNS